MRRLPLVSLILLPLLAPAGVAAAPAVGGTATVDPLVTQVTIDPPPGATPLSSGGGQLPGLDTLTIGLSPDFALAPAAFATCDRAVLVMGPDGCAPDSQVGSGEAAFDAYVGGSTLSGTTDDLRIFRGTGDGELLVYVHASEPADTTYDLELHVTSGTTGPQLVLDASPATVAQGFPVAIRRLRLSFDKLSDGSGDTAPLAAAPVKLADCKPLHGAKRARCERDNRDLEFCRPHAKSCRPRTQRKRRRKPAKARDAATPSRFVTAGACPSGGRSVSYAFTFTDASTAQTSVPVPCA